ncbi:b36d4908-a87d-451c-9dc5-3204af660605-CDS [Sclerotinia trifoliorum]|uniref:B36d4908-a87d-451c-9dc5-3204af660605-CDS n=1 Tax=Sclerotinia trifoliorum TaxID=28548 RepID=A0A8H2VY03_9HELO|nr:b36d4908-a87d-451c-9dc5-3204af660605-CDS [Sclerotinia trifoliorum]
MLAVMGPSGAGKSTFVQLLMGKLKNTSGTTYVNGDARGMSGLKKIISYVPQDDVVLSELMVRENILHSVRIRLPWSWVEKEIERYVDDLLSCLGLSHIQNSLVGDTVKPVISGGQRKRVSIGIELAAAPLALVLDEPTSGLDATSALSIIGLLKALCRLGITVICILHQPRVEIFQSLDRLLLLANGQEIYFATNLETRRGSRKLIFIAIRRP